MDTAVGELLCISFPVQILTRDIYYNINSQLNATIVILLTISISPTCFGR